MKKILLLLIYLSLISCKESSNTIIDKSLDSSHILQNYFQEILDGADIKGSILIYDHSKKIFHSNNFDWANQGHLPASTFKIVNSIIAFETGQIKTQDDIIPWLGQEFANEVWNQDLPFKKAFHYSCLPCYQEIAKNIGFSRMDSFVKSFDYGSMEFSSTNIDNFWIVGDSKISQFQQIDFLSRLYDSSLPISKMTNQKMKEMMIVEKNDDYILRGKTGWSISNNINNGWFVGYIEQKGNVFFFATNVEPKTSLDMTYFPRLRKGVTMEALKRLGFSTQG